MSSRSLNKVILIGNLTRDPELRYTPQGTAVCTFGLATNRSWVTEAGERREETEFHRIVAWNKLAELCSQLLFKGRKVYVEGRLQTRTWTDQGGNQRQVTEVVIEEMIILDSRQGENVGERPVRAEVSPAEVPGEEIPAEIPEEIPPVEPEPSAEQLSGELPSEEEVIPAEKTEEAPVEEKKNDEMNDDIPF